MDELLTMSKRELTRLEIMQRIKEKRLTQKEAARLLEISLRQVKRVWKAYRTQGAQHGFHKVGLLAETMSMSASLGLALKRRRA